MRCADFCSRRLSAVVIASERRSPGNRRLLHDHKARPLQLLHKGLGDDRSHELAGVVFSLAAIEDDAATEGPNRSDQGDA
jgi:hypothetical protein